jgi:hypothetical protein
MPTLGTSSETATRCSSAASNVHSRLLAGVLCIAAAAPAAAQQTLSYSTLLENTGLDGSATVIAARSDGSIVGASWSSGDVRIVRVAAGTHIVTFTVTFGGSKSDAAQSIAVAGDGSLWIVGHTYSSDFPLVNPVLTGPVSPDRGATFLVHLAPDLQTLLFSTVFASPLFSQAAAVAATGSRIVLVGYGASGAVPSMPGVFQPAARGLSDAFVATFAPSGALMAASYLGGNLEERATSLAIGADGDIYVAGTTRSTDLQTTSGAFQPSGGHCIYFGCHESFLARIAADLSRLKYLTYLHGTEFTSGDDTIDAIAVNAAGEAFVAGSTQSGDGFPVTPGAYQTQCKVCIDDKANADTTPGAPVGDGFVMHFSADGSSLVYSTFLSGGGPSLGGQSVNGIVLDGQGRAYVTGSTTAKDFPVVNPFQASLAGGEDGFVARFDPSGSSLEFSTYLGGDETVLQSSGFALAGDEPRQIILTGTGGAAIWVAGTTGTDTFPTTADAYRRTGLSYIGKFGIPVGFLTAFALPTPMLSIDLPAAGNVNPSFEIGGWAIDLGAAADSGIDAVHVYAYPNPGSGAPPIFLGVSALGFARPDVAGAYGPQFGNAGWLLQVTGLSPGPYLLAAFAHSALTDTFAAVQTRAVTVVVTSQPLLSIDTPGEGATVASPPYVGGWAIDRGAPAGTGVDAVVIWAYPNPGSGAAPVFLGVATYGIARGDVGAIFGAPFAASGYELRPAMAPGTYLLAVFAHSTVTHTFAVVQTRMLTIQ